MILIPIAPELLYFGGWDGASPIFHFDHECFVVDTGPSDPHVAGVWACATGPIVYLCHGPTRCNEFGKRGDGCEFYFFGVGCANGGLCCGNGRKAVDEMITDDWIVVSLF